MTSVQPEVVLVADERGSGRRRVGSRAPRGLVALIAAWLGAVLFFGAAVAPSAFAVLSQRSDAGALVGRLLPILFFAGMAVGLTMTVAAMALPSVRRSVRRTLAIAGLVVTAACALAQFWVSPEIAKIRAAAGTQLDSLPPNNRLRMQFGRLHGMSVALLGIAWLGGAAVVVLSFFAPQRRA